MPRDRQKVRRRLQAAALELYRTTGYDLTTAAEIARLAGVTERTFFRHFVDKREVLFGGESALAEILVEAMDDAPSRPWAALLHVFQATEPFFVENREMIAKRSEIIGVTPQLQERELAKVRMLTLTLANRLRDRGTSSETAFLATHVGVAAFTAALSLWLTNDHVSLGKRLAMIFADTGKLTALDV